MKKRLIYCFLFLTHIAFAADNVKDNIDRYSSFNLPNTEVRYLDSKITHESYAIYVSIPPDYYRYPNKKYPAIFLLDADYSFPIATSITNHLADRARISPAFVFGIGYAGESNYKLHRTKDYTPTLVPTGGYGSQYQKFSGGAPAFSQFIQNELLPYCQNSFRLSPQRTLVGHSYGGLFASWLMLNNPQLFSSYIIVSPSLWYDKDYMFKFEKLYSSSHQSLPVNVFFSIGENENSGDFKMVDSLNHYVAILKDRNYRDFQYSYTTVPLEDHDMIFPTAFSEGVIYLFGEKNAISPQSQVFLK